MKDLYELRKSIKEVVHDSGLQIEVAALDEFLLGNCIEDATFELSKMVRSQRKISRKNKIKIIKEGAWDWKELKDKIEGKNFVNVEGKLRSEIVNASVSEAEFSEKMRNLVFEAIFHTVHPVIFDEYKKTVCEYYFPDDVKLTELRKALEKRNIVVLEGKAGIGKTQLVKKYLEGLDKSEWEISWNEVSANLDSQYQIIGKSFRDRIDNINAYIREGDGLLKALQNSNKKIILVFECNVLNEEDYQFLLDNFWGKDVRIIVTTRQCVDDCKFSKVEMPEYPVDILYEIFKLNLNNKEVHLNKEEFTQLCQIIESNTLAVVLLAKSMNKTRWKVATKDLLNPEQWIWKRKDLPLINEKSYLGIGSSYNLLSCLYTILYKFGLLPDDEDLELYSKLSIWSKYEIAKEYVIKWCSGEGEGEIYNEKIEKLLEMGILQYTDKDKKIIQMQPLLPDLMWYKTPISYEKCKDSIKRIMSDLIIGGRWEYSYLMIYEAAWNIVLRFGFSMDKESMEYKEEWWSTICSMITVLHRLGDIKMAERIMHILEKNCKEKEILNKFESALLIIKREEELIQNISDKSIYMMSDLIKKSNGIEKYAYVQILIEWIERVDWGITEPINKEWLSIFGILIKGIENRYFGDFDQIRVIECNMLYHRGIYWMLQGWYTEDAETDLDKIKIREMRQEYGRFLLKRCVDKAINIKEKERELKAKTRLFYYDILSLFISPNCKMEKINSMEEEFKSLEELHDLKMWSWDMEILYKKTRFLYEVFCAAKYGDTLKASATLRELGALFLDQISVSNNEEAKEVIDWMQNEI